MSTPIIPQAPVGTAYRAMPDELTMNTDRFLRIIDRLGRRKKPHGDWCFVSLALCLACLFPLVTTETYKGIFGITPPTWEAILFLGVAIFGAGCLGFSVRWFYIMLKFPEKSSEDILTEVIRQMELERERVARRVAELNPVQPTPDTAPAQSK